VQGLVQAVGDAESETHVHVHVRRCRDFSYPTVRWSEL